MSTATYPRIYRGDAPAARPAPVKRKEPVVIIPTEEEAILIRVVRASGANVLSVCQLVGESVRRKV